MQTKRALVVTRLADRAVAHATRLRRRLNIESGQGLDWHVLGCARLTSIRAKPLCTALACLMWRPAWLMLLRVEHFFTASCEAARVEVPQDRRLWLHTLLCLRALTDSGRHVVNNAHTRHTAHRVNVIP